VDNDRWTDGPAAPAHGDRKVAAPPQPILGGQHSTVLRRTGECGPWTGGRR
jgi:hypothetical protein